MNDEGIAFVNFDYTIELCNGTTQKGRTDNNGYTQRIIADYYAKVINITIHESVDLTCCNQRINVASAGGYTFNLNSSQNPIALSSQGLGTSTKTTKLQAKGRPLTNGEIALAQIIFGSAIDYTVVRVHQGKFLFFQANDTAMTPKGELYMAGEYSIDYSKELDITLQALFIHEMVHVWQYQLSYKVMWIGLWLALKGGYINRRAYQYVNLVQNKLDISEFNMEQQGAIIEDYFADINRANLIDMAQLLDVNGQINVQYVSSINAILKNNSNGILNGVISVDILRILSKFMSKSNDKALLPKTTEI